MITDCRIPPDEVFKVSSGSIVGKAISDVLPPSVIESALDGMEYIRTNGLPLMKTFSLEEDDDEHCFEARMYRHNDCFMAIIRHMNGR